MGTYLLRRLAISVPVLLGITLAVYVIISLARGDPVDALINPEAVTALGPDFREHQREALGLNQPILVLRHLAQRSGPGQPRLLVHGPAGDRGENRRAALADIGADVQCADPGDRDRGSVGGYHQAR